MAILEGVMSVQKSGPCFKDKYKDNRRIMAILEALVITALLTLVSIGVSGSTGQLSTTTGDTVLIPCDFGEGMIRNLYWYYNDGTGPIKILILSRGNLYAKLSIEAAYAQRASLHDDSSTLILRDIVVKDEGTYRCDVDREGQTAVPNINTKLTVFSLTSDTLPEIAQCAAVDAKSSVCSLYSNKSITMNCALSNVYPAKDVELIWYRDEQRVHSTNNSRENDDGTFDITAEIKVSKSGNLTCNATFFTAQGAESTALPVAVWITHVPDAPNAPEKGLSKGGIAGIAVGLAVVVVACPVIIISLRNRKGNKSRSGGQEYALVMNIDQSGNKSRSGGQQYALVTNIDQSGSTSTMSRQLDLHSAKMAMTRTAPDGAAKIGAIYDRTESFLTQKTNDLTSPKMATKMANVTRAALGRAAKIGALYDIRTESFLNDTLFASELDDEMIDIMDLGETAIELVTSDSLEEKCDILDVEAGLKVSLMAGMIKLNGSGCYLAEERKSARAQSMSLIYKCRTVNEEVMVRRNRNKIDLDVLSDPTTDATHVVVAIDWGAICSITCEYENLENMDCAEVKGSLKAEIEMLKDLVDAQGSAKMKYKDRENKQYKKFTFKCKSDVSSPDSDLQVTFEGAVELAQNLPSLVEKTNDGKGVPLTYHLMPLEAVNKICKSRKTLDVRYREINTGTAKKCADILATVTQKRQKLSDIRYNMHANLDFVPDQSVKAIDDIFEEETARESRFREDLKKLVTTVRSGSGDECDLENFLGEREKILSKHCDAISGFQKDLNEVSMIKSLRAKGIRYLGKKDDLALDVKPYVVVLYKMTRSNDTSNFDKIQDFFLRLQATHAADDGYQFIIVNRELSKRFWPSDVANPVIYKYHKGSLECQDLYLKEGQDMEMCLIELAQPVYCQILPKNRAYVCLRCPNGVAGKDLCTGKLVNWRCSKCKQLVEFGTDTGNFYCRCGESAPVDSRFRCNDENHSMMFVSYPSDILNAELSRHRAIKEYNILILGETGVGKSTWINGFQNYLYFDDLNEAMNSPEFHVLIPSSFTFIKDGKAQKIRIGEQDGNEVMETWKSATKEPRAYVFYVGGARIRLIDTPGIGDSEGIEQDRKNVDNILSYLTYYDEIHAVCILLKPNNARLTAMFRFCIQELLVQLHASAKDNIVFCFTNARATFYQPGDTLPALNEELRVRKVGIEATPDNYFCFDNEPFRFLACVRNDVKFSQADIDTYAKSWDKSVEETKRLFGYMNAELKPHKVRETLSMNEARRIIVAMSKPLAEVAKTIDLNVQSAQRAKEQIEMDDSDIRSLEKNLKFVGYGIERVELGYPRTVCTHPSCIEYVPVGSDKVQNIVYKQICHHHCHLQGIPTQTTNNPQLRYCACVGPDENCENAQCKHHYTLHMHLTYDTKVFHEEFLSESIQKKIQKKGTAKTQKEAAKEVIDTKIAELQEEEKYIMRTGAKYGAFLKANALIPYNDAVGDYLDMCIEQEKRKASEFRNKALLYKMQIMKDEYEHQRAILDKAIDTGVGENIRTPEQVKELQKELFQLKHFGPTLKGLFDGISITNSARNISFGEKIVPVPPKYTDNSNTDDVSWWKFWKWGKKTNTS